MSHSGTGPPDVKHHRATLIVTAVVGVLAAAATVAAALITGSNGEAPTTAPTAPAYAQPAPTQTSIVTGNGGESMAIEQPRGATGVGSVKRAANNLVVPDGYSVDLDSDAPDWGVSSFVGGETDILVVDARSVEVYGPDYPGQLSAGLYGRTAPTFHDCVAFTDWESTAKATGTYYCVRTDEGDYAAVLVKKPKGSSAVLAVTVWRQGTAY